MNSKVKIFLVLLLISAFSVAGTYCVFVKTETDTREVYMVKLSTTFLANDDFLAKVQALDPTIVSIDKTTDLHRSTTVPNITLTDANIVSMDWSEEVSTYLWVDNGVLYYYTAADDVDINNN